MLVHEIAEEFQLEHESQGEGVKRHIVLRKLKGTFIDIFLEMNFTLLSSIKL